MKNLIEKIYKPFKINGIVSPRERKKNTFRFLICLISSNLLFYLLFLSHNSIPLEKPSLLLHPGHVAINLPLLNFSSEKRETLVSLFNEKKELIVSKAYLAPTEEAKDSLFSLSTGNSSRLQTLQIPTEDLPKIIRLPAQTMLQAYPYSAEDFSLPKKPRNIYEIIF